MDDRTILDWAATALGHRFRDPELLMTALAHPTHAYEKGGPSNQRLEFLGDAVVGAAISDYLYRRFRQADEGELSKLRAALVSAPTLARLARNLEVGRVLRLGRGEENMGGRDRESNLADAFEALVAAIYLDAGMEAAQAFVLRHLQPEVEAARTGRLNPNYKARLLEWCQRVHGEPPRYEVVAEEGPVHARRYRVRVLVAGRPAGTGEGRSKREAEQQAARVALQTVESS